MLPMLPMLPLLAIHKKKMKIKTNKHVEQVDRIVNTCFKNDVYPIEGAKNGNIGNIADYSLLLEAALAQKLPRRMTLWPGGRTRELTGVDANREVVIQYPRLQDTGPLGIAAVEIMQEIYSLWRGRR